jgi:hypothetical protein
MVAGSRMDLTHPDRTWGENVMAMLLDVAANAGVWGSLALLGWGAAICIRELSTSMSVDLASGEAKGPPQSLLFQ